MRHRASRRREESGDGHRDRVRVRKGGRYGRTWKGNGVIRFINKTNN